MIKSPVLNNHGFSLIEVLVFVSVFTVAIVALVASVSYSALSLNDARHRLMSSRYNEELAEWLKFQREYRLFGYSGLLAKSTPTGTTYCFNNSNIGLDANAIMTSGECTGFDLDDFYKRELTLTSATDEQINVQIVTSYRLLNQTKLVTIELSLYDYGL
ncbi:hypothetical protein A2313_03665 [Candidatus Roizmanbacteria bacterium RIFOXYB2_FULL_41_10]|uniref:Type II secretion system protein GspI C-terminal domain-containing protein n=1 Tax=Candidatus Roizmanbacteria bacterium RIFOXYA1_FULL_41_12 TaxID=1802082 RepID=A0A1F7KEM5_9BACT|nr:MAG: hypothetical protein A2209_02005 [Candidatus Roizmanbacteria bacterium RIFOXYA1_FULL_41_12]OGK66653.1 MAG: hypothetical protein A2262_01615 [Candidatus Roizmanbacteria bacterium RIFOXYA2_FULL_41_8]OGK67111.1 MAG: hypothetical protein A2377_00390 [Candidatus Roizmanbacteria bacterium RIFOXYB1_FULL_41_27]OGK69028.1 MAG: hypothetical protein A2313_03665 [Candidatus Roizmanbacteria bacterium RIFOXYB2_FULL_41_10]OGK71515.1 MAG: hypothetical protein A2403_00730 [Candidatus Roizmanbacteria bac